MWKASTFWGVSFIAGYYVLVSKPKEVYLSPQRYAQIALSGQLPQASISYCIPLCLSTIQHSEWGRSVMMDVCFRQCSSPERQSVFTPLHIHHNKIICPSLNAVQALVQLICKASVTSWLHLYCYTRNGKCLCHLDIMVVWKF